MILGGNFRPVPSLRDCHWIHLENKLLPSKNFFLPLFLVCRLFLPLWLSSSTTIQSLCPLDKNFPVRSNSHCKLLLAYNHAKTRRKCAWKISFCFAICLLGIKWRSHMVSKIKFLRKKIQLLLACVTGNYFLWNRLKPQLLGKDCNSANSLWPLNWAPLSKDLP